MKSITPTAKDMEAFLKQNSDRFRVPEQIQLRYLSFTAADAAERLTFRKPKSRTTWTSKKTTGKRAIPD